MRRVVAVGGRDTVLIRFREPPAAHPCRSGDSPVAAGGFHDALLRIVLIGGRAEQQPIFTIPDTLLLEGGGAIGSDEFLRLSALRGHQSAICLGNDSMQVHCPVLGGGGILMIRLHAADITAELRLTGCIGISRGGAETLFYRHLLVADPGSIGAGGGALYGVRFFVSIIHDLDIEPAACARRLIIRINLYRTGIIEAGGVGGVHIAGALQTVAAPGGDFLRDASLGIVLMLRIAAVRADGAGNAELSIVLIGGGAGKRGAVALRLTKREPATLREFSLRAGAGIRCGIGRAAVAAFHALHQPNLRVSGVPTADERFCALTLCDGDGIAVDNAGNRLRGQRCLLPRHGGGFYTAIAAAGAAVSGGLIRSTGGDVVACLIQSHLSRSIPGEHGGTIFCGADKHEPLGGGVAGGHEAVGIEMLLHLRGVVCGGGDAPAALDDGGNGAVCGAETHAATGGFREGPVGGGTGGARRQILCLQLHAPVTVAGQPGGDGFCRTGSKGEAEAAPGSGADGEHTALQLQLCVPAPDGVVTHAGGGSGRFCGVICGSARNRFIAERQHGFYHTPAFFLRRGGSFLAGIGGEAAGIFPAVAGIAGGRFFCVVALAIRRVLRTGEHLIAEVGEVLARGGHGGIRHASGDGIGAFLQEDGLLGGGVPVRGVLGVRPITGRQSGVEREDESGTVLANLQRATVIDREGGFHIGAAGGNGE